MTMHKTSFGPVLALLIAVSGGLADEKVGVKKAASVEGITEYQFDNGVRLLLFPDNSRPTVTVNMTVLVGSRHEGYGETGMAHLLEHMVFKGTPTHTDIPKALKERGANFNGTTWLDRTNYFETMPAGDENLEFGIRLEADRLVNSFIKRDDLISEMTVVRNEFEMGENDPGSILSQRMMAVAYEWHNYGKSTIGNRSDIERVPIDNLQAFYRKHYQPDNVIVVVAGQFDEKQALDYVTKYFGAHPRPKRKLDTTDTEEPAQDGERNVTLRRVGDVGVVGVLYHIPAGPHPDFAAIRVLNNVLNSEPSGRLYKALVESKMATEVGGFAYALHDPGVIEINARVRRGDSLDDVRDTMLQVVEAVGDKGVTEEELKRAKAQLLKQWEEGLADSRRVAIQLSDWAAQGDWRLFFIHRDRLEKVTAEDVKRVAAQYLRRNNRTVGVYIPTEKPERIAIPSTPDVKTLVADYKGRAQIAAGEAFDVSPENIEKRTKREKGPEGIKLALLPKKTRGEEVNLRLTLRYGDADSLRGLNAAAELLPRLMTRGTKRLTHQMIQDELTKQQATLNATGDAGMMQFTVRTKRANLSAVLGLLRQILREPAPAASEFEVLKREELAGLEEEKTDPHALSSRLLRQQLSPYPKDDVRYAPSVEEEIARFQAVTFDDVKTLYRDFVGAQSGELTVVGDFDPTEVTPIITEMLADWKAAKPYARIERPGKPTTRAKHSVLTPDKANATYIAGQMLPLRNDDPDYPALVIGNYILGGGSLSSRLGDRVRQKEGLSYGVGSMLNADALDKRASFMVFAIFNPTNRDKVESVIQEELDLLLKQGISEEELAKAKQGYLQERRVSRTADRMLTAMLGDGLYHGRTMAYYADLEKKVEALTAAQVTAALRKHIDLKKLVVVTAGDFDKKAGGER